jgi:predicted anti-sigma-YlaC factor YlaD
MIRCLFSQKEIRRNLDDNAALSPETLKHLETCDECAALLKSQSALVKVLKSRRDENLEIPFLRARILNAIQSGAGRRPSTPLRAIWTSLAAVTMVALMFALLPRSKTAQSQNAAPAWELPRFAAVPPEFTESLDTELESLKSDTQRAARALAASFLPTER